MKTTGATFYDNDAIFATYTENRRLRPDNPNDTLEKPVIVELIGAVAGKAILDLGCGDAAIGPELLQQGATAYLGIDSSANMVASATQTLAGTAGRVIQHTIEDWRYAEATFDLVISRLALHYVADFPALCAKIIGSLRPGGQFVFSVEHPVITSCERGWAKEGPRQDWLVDNYFDTGLRVTEWLGGQVEKYHRTVEEYFNTLQQVGFVVEQLRESCPQREYFQEEQTYLRRKRIPLFLFLVGRKPG
jgi:SAM-dependent methyltransferase